jgi:hypothetical protein
LPLASMMLVIVASPIVYPVTELNCLIVIVYLISTIYAAIIIAIYIVLSKRLSYCLMELLVI